MIRCALEVALAFGRTIVLAGRRIQLNADIFAWCSSNTANISYGANAFFTDLDDLPDAQGEIGCHFAQLTSLSSGDAVLAYA